MGEYKFKMSEMRFTKHPTDGMMYLGFYSYRAMKRIGEIMYRDATVFLDRKKAMFDNLEPSLHKYLDCEDDIYKLFLEGEGSWFSTFDILQSLVRKYGKELISKTLRKFENNGILISDSAKNGMGNMRKYTFDFEAYTDSYYTKPEYD